MTADPLAKRAAAVNGMDEVIDADIDGVLQFSAAGGLLLRDPAEDFLILLDHAAKVRRLKFAGVLSWPVTIASRNPPAIGAVPNARSASPAMPVSPVSLESAPQQSCRRFRASAYE